jgi:GTP diphosphokinase / guanosine-3',5'-bis(diphosphate) 3'-diphosphatase
MRQHHLPEKGGLMLEDAIAFAAHAHKGQKDRAGEPYVLHPLRVMDALRGHGELVMMAAVLHDVLEDTMVTEAELRDRFPRPVCSLVSIVTKRTGTYREYISRCARDPIAREIKIADVTDNMRKVPVEFEEWRSRMIRDRYEPALSVLINARIGDLPDMLLRRMKEAS